MQVRFFYFLFLKVASIVMKRLLIFCNNIASVSNLYYTWWCIYFIMNKIMMEIILSLCYQWTLEFLIPFFLTKVTENYIYSRIVIELTYTQARRYIFFILLPNCLPLVLVLIVCRVIEFFLRELSYNPDAIPSIACDTFWSSFPRGILFLEHFLLHVRTDQWGIRIVSAGSSISFARKWSRRLSWSRKRLFVPFLIDRRAPFFFRSEGLQDRGGSTGRIFSRGEFFSGFFLSVDYPRRALYVSCTSWKGS